MDSTLRQNILQITPDRVFKIKIFSQSRVNFIRIIGFQAFNYFWFKKSFYSSCFITIKNSINRNYFFELQFLNQKSSIVESTYRHLSYSYNPGIIIYLK